MYVCVLKYTHLHQTTDIALQSTVYSSKPIFNIIIINLPHNNFSMEKLQLYFTAIFMSPLRMKGDIWFSSDFFFFRFRFFSAKLVWTITFLSFQIGQLYLVCGCMTIRRCVAYRNDLRGTLTFDLKIK